MHGILVPEWQVDELFFMDYSLLINLYRLGTTRSVPDDSTPFAKTSKALFRRKWSVAGYINYAIPMPFLSE